MGGIVQAFAGMTVGEYETAARDFLDGAQHPTLGRRLQDATYLPMVELLRYLEANGFVTYIASGGDRDFMRPVTYDDLRHPVRADHRQLDATCATRRTRPEARSSTRPRWTSSTTGR